MSLTIAAAILSLLPAIQAVGETYCMSLPSFSVWIVVFVISIISAQIPPDLKKSCITILLYLYWRNIHLLFATLTPLSLLDKHTSLDATKAALSVHFHFKINNLGSERKHPTIFICNYAADRFENLFPLFLPKQVTFIMSELFADISNFDNMIPSIVVPKANSFQKITRLINTAIKNGNDVLCYCQKPLFVDGDNYGRIRTGIYKIARDNKLTITPLYIEPIKTFMNAVCYQEIQITAADPIVVTEVSQAILYTKTFFKKINEPRL
jgi:hypothetical protein